MGGNIHVYERKVICNEPLATLSVSTSELKGVEIKAEEIPALIDEIPLVALLATQAKGITKVQGASELRVKESDRIAATVKELSKLGARIEELPDGMVIHGGVELKGARVDSHGDHRLAMTLGIAGLVAKGRTAVRDAGAVAVSYPGFWDDLKRLAHS